MIHSLYQLINKGSFRTLSFILALGLTAVFFFNVDNFSTLLRNDSPWWILMIFWGLITVWIHGIGFEIKSVIGKLIFLPYIAYIIILISAVEHFYLRG
ncbi:MAG: cyd operon protein YbgE [Haemophilus haemolyticus]|jgi:cyd operon protein ybgE|nr:putative cyd operon protein YbgE [Haemophilus haemolyticus M21621]EGT80521.1 putative cyd operon protein YbgE [Haemophilus haemolyticus M21621]MBS6021535.1 cyd operon protein YbgE [Haemophilus haemolyticus]